MTLKNQKSRLGFVALGLPLVLAMNACSSTNHASSPTSTSTGTSTTSAQTSTSVASTNPGSTSPTTSAVPANTGTGGGSPNAAAITSVIFTGTTKAPRVTVNGTDLGSEPQPNPTYTPEGHPPLCPL